MTKQTRDPRPASAAVSDADALDTANLHSAWRRFRNELDARLVERFGVAFQDTDGEQADPAVLADLALERALMS